MINFIGKGLLPSGFEVEFGILKNKHLVELTKARKNTSQDTLMRIIAEVTTRIGSNNKVDAKLIGELTPMDFKQLLCLIRQNTHEYPETIEQPMSYEEIDDRGIKTGKFTEFMVNEEIPDGEFPMTMGTLAVINGYDKNNTVLKDYSTEFIREYTVEIPASKRRESMTITMTAPKLVVYAAIEGGDIVTIINQRKPTIDTSKGKLRVNIGDMPMNTSTFLMKQIEIAEGQVFTQSQFTHPATDQQQVIDFTDYPEFLLGKS
jgi:hypothetical protein